MFSHISYSAVLFLFYVNNFKACVITGYFPVDLSLSLTVLHSDSLFHSVPNYFLCSVLCPSLIMFREGVGNSVDLFVND